MPFRKKRGSSDSTETPKYLRKGIDNPYFHPVSKRFGRLPQWLDHFNKRDLKVLFKCWAAAWAYSLLIVIDLSLVAIGQACFFGVIVLFMAPPSGVVFIGLLGGGTLVLGLCLGWAWGAITMKAALATRSSGELLVRLQQLQAEVSQNTTYSQQASGQDTYAEIAVYNGFMLDARVSATYFCMIGVFVYFMARLRVIAPKFQLTAIFSMVVADIYLTIAPLIPTFQGTIAQVLVKPAAIATGFGLLTPMNTFLEACILNFRDPVKDMDLNRLKQTKANTIAAYKALEEGLGFLALDASMGRWNAQDIASLREPIRRVIISFLNLLHVQISTREFQMKDKELLDMVESTQYREGTNAGYYQVAKAFDFRQRTIHPDVQGPRNESLKALAVSAQSIVDTCQNTINTIIDSLHNCNTRRWIKRPSAQECEVNRKQHATTLDELRMEKATFAQRAAEELWKPYSSLFDAEGHFKPTDNRGLPPAGGLMLGLVFEERIYELADALDVLLTKIVSLEASRTKTQLWLPGGLQNLVSWAIKDDHVTADTTSNAVLNFSDNDRKAKKRTTHTNNLEKDQGLDKMTAAAQLVNMQARGGTQRSRTGVLLISVINWLTNAEGLFALRMVVLTVAVGIPAVLPTSAGFYYVQKGVWALIMAQTGLYPYTADFIFGMITKLFGTVAGAVVGLVAWYIGAGKGPGNPYGMAAVLAVILVFLMWLRLYLPPSTIQAVVLGVVTCYLVVGYSWADVRIPSYGEPGVGFSVFWRRLVLVIVGFTAAIIVTFFPRPPSANRHYRELLSYSLESVKNRFALLVANCKHPSSDLFEVTEDNALATSELLTEMEPHIALITFEFSTSNFDADILALVCHLCQNLNQAVTQLLLYAPTLPEPLKKRFIHVTDMMEEQLLADVMAVLTLLQQALKSGDPLPVVLPVPLLARSIETLQKRTADVEAVLFNKELLAEVGVRKYCSAISAYVQFLSSIDELVLLVKRAVGETSYLDLER